MARFPHDFREISEVFDGFVHNFGKLAKADLHAVHNAAGATDDEAMRGKIFADQSAQDYARDHAEQQTRLDWKRMHWRDRDDRASA